MCHSHSGSPNCHLWIPHSCFGWVLYIYDNKCTFISDKNIKDSNLLMHTSHITNGCLQKKAVYPLCFREAKIIAISLIFFSGCPIFFWQKILNKSALKFVKNWFWNFFWNAEKSLWTWNNGPCLDWHHHFKERRTAFKSDKYQWRPSTTRNAVIVKCTVWWKQMKDCLWDSFMIRLSFLLGHVKPLLLKIWGWNELHPN